MSTKNPLQRDPLLCQSLHDVRSVDKDHFQRWRASFLKRYEAFLEESGTAIAKAKYKNYSRNVKKLMHLILKVKHYIDHRDLTEANTSVKARKTLSELSKQITIVVEQQDALLPMTGQMEKEFGYNKFHMGAVLVRDNFSEYRRLTMCAEILSSKFKVRLQNVANRQIMKELDRFGVKFQTFCDVIADLGLRDTLIKCNELAPLFEAERKKRAQEKNSQFEPIDEDNAASSTPQFVDSYGSLNSSFGASTTSFPDYSSSWSDDSLESEKALVIPVNQYCSPSSRKHRKIENFSFFELDPTYEVDSDSEESATERTVEEEVVARETPANSNASKPKATAAIHKTREDEFKRGVPDKREEKFLILDQPSSDAKKLQTSSSETPESLEDITPLHNKEAASESPQDANRRVPQVMPIPAPLPADDEVSSDDEESESKQANTPVDTLTGTTRKPRKIENFSFFELDPTYEVDSDSDESATERTAADEDEIIQVKPFRKSAKKRRPVVSIERTPQECSQDKIDIDMTVSDARSWQAKDEPKEECLNAKKPPVHSSMRPVSLQGNSANGKALRKQEDEDKDDENPSPQPPVRPDSLRGNSIEGEEKEKGETAKSSPTRAAMTPDHVAPEQQQDNEVEEKENSQAKPRIHASMRPDLLRGNSCHGGRHPERRDEADELEENQGEKKSPPSTSMRPDALRGNSAHGDPEKKPEVEDRERKSRATPLMQPAMRPDSLRGSSIHGDSNQKQQNEGEEEQERQATRKSPTQTSMRPDSLRGSSVHGDPELKPEAEEKGKSRATPATHTSVRPDTLRGSSFHARRHQQQEDEADENQEKKRSPPPTSMRPDSLRGNSAHGDPEQKPEIEDKERKSRATTLMHPSMRPDSLRGSSIHGDSKQKQEHESEEEQKRQATRRSTTQTSMRPDSLRGSSVHGNPELKPEAEEKQKSRAKPATHMSERPDTLRGSSFHDPRHQQQEEEASASQGTRKSPPPLSTRPDSLRGNSIHGDPEQKTEVEEKAKRREKPLMNTSVRTGSLRGNSIHGEAIEKDCTREKPARHTSVHGRVPFAGDETDKKLPPSAATDKTDNLSPSNSGQHNDFNSDQDPSSTRLTDTSNVKRQPKGLPLESSTSARASTTEEPKQKQQNTVRETAKQPTKAASLKSVKAPGPTLVSDKEDNPKAEPLAEEKARKCYMWYARMGMPTKQQMKKRVAALPKGCDITLEDVDMLPWVGGGSMLSVTKMNKLFLED